MQPDEHDYTIDTKTPSGARMYDYTLGGTDNYACDRVAAQHVEELIPESFAVMRNNRRFLERAVAYLTRDCGIRQFIDNGSGLPTQNNVHQVAQSIAPDARVVYIDYDEVVLAHQKVQALETGNTAFLLEDARNVDRILNHPDTRRLIDFDEPVAVLYLSFLHFIADENDPWGVVRHMVQHLAPASYLAVSHVSADSPEVRQNLTDFGQEYLGGRFGRWRAKQEIRKFFNDLEPIEPGLVNVTTWRPDGREEEQTHEWMEFGGVAKKP